MDLAMRNAPIQSREYDRRLANAAQGQLMGRGQAGVFGGSTALGGFAKGVTTDTIQGQLNRYWLDEDGPNEWARDFRMRRTSSDVKEYINNLPKPYNDIALQYLEPRNEEYEVKSVIDALELAFYWDETLEGTGFWIQLADALEGKGEYPEFEVVMVDGPAKGQKKKFNKIEQMIQVQYIQEVGTTESEDGIPKEIECEMKCTVYGHKKGLEFEWIGVVDDKDVLKNDWTKPDYVEYVD